MRGLYAIVDLGTLDSQGLDPVQFCRELLRAPLGAVQLRAKHVSAGRVLAVAKELVRLCRSCVGPSGLPVPFFVNDRFDIAVIAGATGVHVGQTDPPVEALRGLVPQLRVGVSTHTLVQLESALRLKPDYVAFGPVFPTHSKSEPDACVGIEGLQDAHRRAKAAGVPLVGIGGIGPHNARCVAPWLDAAASIGSLSSSGALGEVCERAAHMAELLRCR